MLNSHFHLYALSSRPLMSLSPFTFISKYPGFGRRRKKMSDPNQGMNTTYNNTYNNTLVSLSGQITVAVVVVIFALFIIILIVYIKSRGYAATTGSLRSRSRLRFATQEPTLPRRALDPSILNSLPITVFQSKNLKEEDSCLECAVCICELTDGENVRLLPNCKHCFHVECIDMWFHSNNTCPLCRNLVTEIEPATSVEITIQPSAAVLEPGSCSTSSAPSTSRKRLVIDIPRPAANGFSAPNMPSVSSKIPSNSPLPKSRLLEEIKSPKSPVIGKMKSLKRMMSRVSFKGVGTSYSHMGCDIEKGEAVDSKCQ